ncbi:MAG: response regulator [Bacteroidota bacterium]
MADQVEILLVEDNPYDAELALRALKQNNLANKVVHVTDGEEALDFLFSRGDFASREMKKPKVILLDLKLPKVGGLEVLKIVKNNPALKQIPVVVLTSSREEKDIVESYDLGVNSYMVKPVAFDKFIEVIKDLGMYWLILNQVP